MTKINKKILVAGGSGFIGSHLCESLIEFGHKVTAVDNLVTGSIDNLFRLRNHSEFLFVHADVSGEIPVSLCQSHFDEIYNLASPASPADFAHMPLFILQTASQGHFALLELARKMGARILYASSSEVYGDALQHPQNELYFGNVSPIGPRSCYDEAKRFGEALSMAHHTTYRTNICIARIFNTYGPRMRPADGRIIPNFFTQALNGRPLTVYGDGQQTRSFCYVTDLVNGLIALMNSNEKGPINLGNPIEKKVIEMADIINKLTGNPGGVEFYPLPENDPKQRRPDISKALKLLKWSPEIELTGGLDECLKYFTHYAEDDDDDDDDGGGVVWQRSEKR